MKKLYVLLLTLLSFPLVFPLHAQEVFWAAADRYQGAARLVTALTNSGKNVEYPIPPTNNDLWGDIRPQIYKGSDGNIYGVNKNAEGTLLYKITNDGIFPVYQFEYGSFGPMAEGDAGRFYVFSSGADGNYVVVERVDKNGANYKKYGFYKPGFRPERLLNSGGEIYGVSTSGGAYSGSGYVFKFTPTDDLKSFKVLYNFSSTNGRKPVGALTEGPDGFLYGVTSTGGADEGGVIYKIKKDGTGFTKLHDFGFSTGRYPSTGLVTDGAGWFYGRTSNGWTTGNGAIFKIRFDGTGFANIDSFGPGSSGDLAYKDGHIYAFHRYSGQDPAILKLNVNKGVSYFYVFADGSSQPYFEGESIIIDPSPSQAKVLTKSPANGGTVASTKTRLEFTPVTNATSYYFELSKSSSFSVLTHAGSNTEPSFTVEQLQPNTTYYVRVKSNVWPTFGPTTSFRTVESTSNVTWISNPKDGATNVSAPSSKVTAGLISGAKRYTIELSTTPDFATKLVRTSKVDNQRTMVFDSLKYSTKYYGRFKTDVSGYGRVTSFTTAAETFPRLVSPVGADVSPYVVDLVVEPSRTDSRRYTLEVLSYAPYPNIPITIKSIEDYQTHHIVKNLHEATIYFVRIKSDLNENWSPLYQFKTRERAASKSLWGVTTSGGASDAGTVFRYELNTKSFSKVYDYHPNTEGDGEYYFDFGEALQGSLIHGTEEKLYFHSSTKGSSAYGGALFEVDRYNNVNHIQEIALHYGNMTLGADNTIYTSVNSHLGPGVIDSYELHSETWKRLKVFVQSMGVDPGSELLELGDGYLYGRATAGGVNNGGTIYRIRYDGSGFQVIHRFADAANGSHPTGDLVYGSDGFFYGTTQAGGAYGKGTVYKISKDGSSFLRIWDFNGTNGSAPLGGVILHNNTLYGTTSAGGAFNHGTIFKLSPAGGGFVKLHDFSGTAGSTPVGRLTEDAGILYGMTSLGGVQNKGSIFSITPTGSNYSVLHSFDGSGGAYPDGHLTVREDAWTAYAMTINNEAQDALVGVSPNPSTTDFEISFATPDAKDVAITITDSNGMVVHESVASAAESQRVGQGLQKGIYILTVRSNDKVSTHRLVKK
ncbi:MAG TPA: choice-of-anchor tandem repeat GloVer-containing protein [Chryseosolibacter sp.]